MHRFPEIKSKRGTSPPANSRLHRRYCDKPFRNCVARPNGQEDRPHRRRDESRGAASIFNPSSSTCRGSIKNVPISNSISTSLRQNSREHFQRMAGAAFDWNVAGNRQRHFRSRKRRKRLDSPIDSAVRFGPAIFTFRGDPRDPMLGTSLRLTELNGLSWHNRAADVIMLGAIFYNRQIQLQQLYIKQRKNELSMSGKAQSLPNRPTGSIPISADKFSERSLISGNSLNFSAPAHTILPARSRLKERSTRASANSADF